MNYDRETSLVSVIIPTHNRVNLLSRAVKSVFKQTYTNFECIVIDDASDDRTKEVINLFSDDRLLYYRHSKTLGASAARNTGINYAKGELIAFLDDDDEWLSTKLEKQVPLLKSLPEIFGMVYCWMNYYDSNNKLVREHHPILNGYVFPYLLDTQRLGGCPTLLVRRSVVNDVGGFDENLPRGNDGDFIRRIALKYKVDLVREVLVKVFIGHGEPRIGNNKKSGIENHIFSQLTKIKKFENELKVYSKEKANIFFDLARNYAKLGNWRKSICYYYKGIKINPFSLKLYLSLFHHLK